MGQVMVPVPKAAYAAREIAATRVRPEAMTNLIFMVPPENRNYQSLPDALQAAASERERANLLLSERASGKEPHSRLAI